MHDREFKLSEIFRDFSKRSNLNFKFMNSMNYFMEKMKYFKEKMKYFMEKMKYFIEKMKYCG